MSWEMTMAAMLAITAGAAVYVAWPLLMGGTRAEEHLEFAGGEGILQRLFARRELAGSALRELEFENAMGKLPEEDYDELREQYQQQQATILKRIEQSRAGRLPTGYNLEDLDEVEDLEEARPVLRRRAAEADADLDLEEEITAYRGKALESSAAPVMVRCSSCGHPVKDPEAAFCGKCGSSIRTAGPAKRRGAQGKRRS